MGVPYLTSFLTNICENGMSVVDILELIKHNIDTPQYDNTIVIDGSSFAHQAYLGLDWLCGGQAIQFEEKIIQFCNKITATGCGIVVIFSGSHVPSKHRTWIDRQKKKIGNVCNIFQDINNVGKIILHNNIFLKLVAVDAFKKAPNVEVMYSVGASDQEVACFARVNKCLAVIGEDSDFVIYDVDNYLSAKHLNFTTLQTKSYNKEALLKALHLKKELLPLLAALLGNEFIPVHMLKQFHCGFRTNRTESIIGVASFIRHHSPDTTDFNLVSQLLVGDDSMAKALRDCVLAYTFKLDTGFPETCSESLKFVLEKHIQAETSVYIFNVVYHAKFYSSVVLENLRKENMTPISTITRKIRHQIYEILSPKSKYVTEYYIENKKNYWTIVPHQVYLLKDGNYPELIDIWTCNDSDLKWSLFCSAIDPKLNLNALKKLPNTLIIPAVALYFLYQEDNCFSELEINAFVEQIIAVYHKKNINIPDIVEYNENAVQLAARFIYTIDMILFLNSTCGNIVALEHSAIVNYFDGKLFHHIYNDGKYSEGVKTESFSFPQNFISLEIKKFIFEN